MSRMEVAAELQRCLDNPRSRPSKEALQAAVALLRVQPLNARQLAPLVARHFEGCTPAVKRKAHGFAHAVERAQGIGKEKPMVSPMLDVPVGP